MGLDRLLEVLLPYGGGVLVIEGYFDESGDLDSGDGIFCVAGYFLSDTSARAMDAEWGQVLQEHGIPIFHMVDCAHGTDAFSGKSFEERTEIVKKLIALIKLYTLEGFAAIAKRSAFPISEDAYSHCVEMAVGAMQVFLQQFRLADKLAFFFESGHTSRGRAYAKIGEKFEAHLGSLTFAKKQDVRLLQAADLLAWQCAKYVKDRYSKARPPRKDFESLMEHPHSFFHIVIDDKGGKSMGLEAWPLSRRSQKTVSISIDTDGPFTFLRESGSTRPIIPVEEALGYELGAGRMAYINVKAMGGKEFGLAFDEMRLFEMAGCLLGATSVYADRKLALMLGVESLSVVREKDAIIIQVNLLSGGRVAFGLSEEVFEKLRSQ